MGAQWLDLGEDLLVVGDPGEGVVQVFERGVGGNGWIAAGVVNAPDSDGPRGMSIGSTVALFQDEILVGQMTIVFDGDVSLGGVVHRLARVDGAWTAVGTLEPDEANQRSGFGMSLAVDGASLLVGGGSEVFVYGRSEDHRDPSGAVVTPLELEGTVPVFEADDDRMPSFRPTRLWRSGATSALSATPRPTSDWARWWC